MWKCAILTIFIQLQKPDYRSKQYYWGFHKKVSLFLHPAFIEVKHDCITGLVSIRNIRHKLWCQRVATVAFSRIVEIDYIKLGWYLIAVSVLNQVVIGDN